MSMLAYPRLMYIGGGTSRQLGDVLDRLGCSRPLVITDTFLESSGAVSNLLATLPSSTAVTVYSDTVPDPTTDSIAALIASVDLEGVDCVVGFGGGSPIDTAKAVALQASLGGHMSEYRAPRQVDEPIMPIIAIPTTAGTGSECTRFTIIVDSDSGEKMLCIGLAYLPTAALVDYELTLTMPRRLSADTGVDALTHAIEAYVSARANGFSDSLALAAMSSIADNLRTVWDRPDDRPAREAMMLAATQAGMAFSNSSVALVHGMSRPIGGHFGVAHGLSNAMLLPSVTEFSLGHAQRRYAECARAMRWAAADDSDGDATRTLAQGLRALNEELEVPRPRECGIREAAWHDAVPTMAREALRSGSPDNNPRVPSAEEIELLYRELW